MYAGNVCREVSLIRMESQNEVNVNELVESLQAYEFFSNQVKVNIANNQGIRLILEKLTKIEQMLENQPMKMALGSSINEDLAKKDDLPIPSKDVQQ